MKEPNNLNRIIIAILTLAIVCAIFVACDSFGDIFDDKTYYVTLDLGDEVIKWKDGDAIPNPTRDGYYFGGWYSEKECENAVTIDFATYKPLDDLYLYAKWIELGTFENIVFEDLTVAYDGSAHGIEIDGVPDDAQVKFLTDNSFVLPGQYEVIVEISKEHYNTLTMSAILLIEPLAFENITFESVSVDYDGKAHRVEVVGAPSGATVEYDKSNSYVLPGVYNVCATISMVGYKTQKMEATLTINALDFEGIAFEKVVATYDGKPHTVRVDGVPNGAHVEYSGVITHTNAGTYKVCATITKTGYNPLTLESELVINKAQIIDVEFNGLVVTWDGNSHSVYVTNLPDGVSVSYQNNGKVDVGQYQVVASFDTGNNYLPLDDMIATLLIKELMHKISFIDGDGTTFEIEVGHGKKMFEPPIPTNKAGYSASWDKDVTCEIVSDMTVSAVYVPIVYSITYDFDGGYCLDARTTYTVEDDVTLPKENVGKQGYKFGGWYLSSDFIGESIVGWTVGERLGDVKVYAKWNAEQYTIHYDINCKDAALDGAIITTFDKDSEVIILTKPYRPACTFLGWYCVEDDKIIDSITPQNYDGDIHLIACWSVTKYNLYYNLNGGALEGDNPTTFDNYTPLEINNPTKFGYAFDGWLVNGVSKFTGSLSGFLEPVTLHASWTPIIYNITYHVGIADYVLEGENVSEFTIESKGVELVNPTKEHYIFLGWYSDSECTNRVYATEDYVTGDREYFGKWEIVVYNISYNALLGNNHDDNRATYTIEDNLISLSAPTRLGYEFLGWYLASESDIDKESILDSWYLSRERVDSLQAEGGDLYFVARWKIVVYKITYENVGLNENLNPTEFDINNSNAVFVPLNDDNFVMWTLDGKEIEYLEPSLIGKDLTIVAVYKQSPPPLDTTWTVENGIITSYNGYDTEITIPEVFNDITIKGVAIGAFGDKASTITTLNFPSSIEYMQDGLLADFSSLVNLTIPFVGQTKYREGFIGGIHSFSYLFASDKRDDYIGVLKQPVEYSESGFVCHEDGTYNYIPKTLENVTVLGGSLAYRAFAYCTMIKSVTLVDCEALEDQAIRGCTSLEKVAIESENTTFKNAVFAGSTSNLKEVSVASITQQNYMVDFGVDRSIIIVKEVAR